VRFGFRVIAAGLPVARALLNSVARHRVAAEVHVNAFKHILVPTDFGDCADHALDVAVALAKRLDAKITLLHVCELPVSGYAMYAQGLYFPMDALEAAAQKALDSAAALLRERYPASDAMLRSGTAVEQLMAARDELHADLIVMGTHGRRGVSRMLLGSVAEKTVRMSKVPVLTVPAKDLEEPAAK
jgi:nucleotide-binding universal stress UspA family protein